jgi:hypothetical protein
MILGAIFALCLLTGRDSGIVFFTPLTTTPQDQSNSPSQGSQAQSSHPSASEGQGQSAAPPQPTGATSPDSQKAQPASAVSESCKAGDSSKGKTGKRRKCRKTDAPAEPSASTNPVQTVVPNGGTTAPIVELSPGLTPQQLSDQRERTKELMAKCDADLKKISEKQLTASQQDTVNQIKSYLEQANQAVTDGDLQRAHNLALKANLLSTELAGR